MAKVTKIGNTNCNPRLKCEFCDKLIPLGLSYYSVILPVSNNPPRNYIACEECANEYKKLSEV